VSVRTAISRASATAGALAALWLFSPAVAHADSGCVGVSYRPRNASTSGPPATDPCAGQAESGAGTLGVAALAATAAGLALSAARGRIPTPAEGALAAPPPPPAPGSGSPLPATAAGTAPPASRGGPAALAAGPGQRGEGNGSCRTGGDPVDVVSGQMITTKTDVELPGVLPLILRRAYASGYGHGRLLGPGWSSTLEQCLEIDGQFIHYIGDDAQILSYPHPAKPDRAVLPVDGARWPLVRDADGTIRIEDPERGWTRHFAPSPDPAALPITALTDRNGNRITYHRDGTTPIRVEHSGGYHVAVDSVATASGLRIATLRLLDGTNGGHGTVLRHYGYDPRGRLTGVSDSTGVPFGYTYDDADRISAWIDRLGYRYEYAYNDEGRVVRCEGPHGTLSATFAYSTLHGVTIVADSLGHTTEYHYDRHNHVTKTVDPLGNSVLTNLDRYGRLLAHTDELGHTTRFTLDEHGNPVRIDRPDGTTVLVLYNGLRLPTHVTGPDGAVWQYTYDPRGNLLTRTDPLGAVTAYTHSPRGHLTSVTDALGNILRVETNAAGLPLAITDALGNTTRAARDAFGHVTEISDPLNNRTILAWTPEGLLASRTHPDGTVERWNYDAQGNLTGYQDQNGVQSTTEYGPFGHPTAQTGPNAARYELAYDTELRLASVTGPTGLIWQYERDAAGRLIAEIDFDGRRLGYGLDAAGRVIERINGAGQRVSYQRDALGRLIEARQDPDAVSTYGYDPAGRLVRAQNPDATVEYTRDALGQVLSESVNGARSTYEYDPCGRRVRRTTPTGAVSIWKYDAAGQPAELATLGNWLAFSYDAAGRETTRHLGSTAAITQTFDTTDRLVAQSIWSQDAAGIRPLRQRAYAYRADGNLASVRDAQSGIKQFDLDALGRMTGVQGDGWTERYVYDAMGNLTHAEWPSSDDTAQGRREYSGSRIRSAGRVSYEHDEQGRVTRTTRRTLSGQSRHWHYSWDADDRLTQAITPDGTVWRYRYDPLGRRTAKQRLDSGGEVTEQTTFAWDGTRLAEQVRHVADTRSETITWDYEPGTHRPLTQLQRLEALEAPQDEIDQRFYAIVTDLVGTPTELVDSDGRLTATRTTNLWGSRLTSDDGPACPLDFPGQYHDDETGLNYNYQRYYDPAAGRYTVPDPLGLAPAPNPYAYVDNPLIWLDPLGLVPTGGSGSDGLEWVDPTTINFSQRTINGNNYAEQMRAGTWDWERPGTALRVMDVNGQLVTYDNRRLNAALEVGSPRVPITRVDPAAPDWISTAGRTWQQAFTKRLNDPLNVRAGGRLPPEGTSKRPTVCP
jgi:RHS repeat-associated protein